MLRISFATKLDKVEREKKRISEERKHLKRDTEVLETQIRSELDQLCLEGHLKNSKRPNAYNNDYLVVNGTFVYYIHIGRTGNTIGFGIYMYIPDRYMDLDPKRKTVAPFNPLRYYPYNEIKTTWFWDKLSHWEHELLEKIFFN